MLVLSSQGTCLIIRINYYYYYIFFKVNLLMMIKNLINGAIMHGPDE